MSQLEPTLAQEFAAALAWWQAAGVDCDFTDDATALLAQTPIAAPQVALQQVRPTAGGRAATSPPGPLHDPAHQTAPSAANQPVAASPRRDLLGDSPPIDLAAFRQWWMEASGLDTARGFPRIPPRGAAGAALMVLVPQPEAEDSDRLLSGPQGRLLDQILAAMGLDESQVYVAAALPCHTPMADLGALAATGLDAVTAHHIALVAPTRLVAFGTGLGPMIGISAEHPLREINQTGGRVPAMASETLDSLMDMPRLKARFWRRWMEWSAKV